MRVDLRMVADDLLAPDRIRQDHPPALGVGVSAVVGRSFTINQDGCSPGCAPGLQRPSRESATPATHSARAFVRRSHSSRDCAWLAVGAVPVGRRAGRFLWTSSWGWVTSLWEGPSLVGDDRPKGRRLGHRGGHHDGSGCSRRPGAPGAPRAPVARRPPARRRDRPARHASLSRAHPIRMARAKPRSSSSEASSTHVFSAGVMFAVVLASRRRAADGPDRRPPPRHAKLL